MAEILNLGEEQIRISQKVYGQIEYSISRGKTWKMRFKGSYQIGEFKDLIDLGPVVLAITSKGLFCSSDNGVSWIKRFSPNAFTGDFIKFNFYILYFKLICFFFVLITYFRFLFFYL